MKGLVCEYEWWCDSSYFGNRFYTPFSDLNELRLIVLMEWTAAVTCFYTNLKLNYVIVMALAFVIISV